MSTKFHCIFFILLMGVFSGSLNGQAASDQRGDIPPSAPPWTDIIALRASQSSSLLTLTMEMADSIPRSVKDSCAFQFLLDTDANENTGFKFGTLGVDNLIEFDLSHWDGAPWNAMFMNGHLGTEHWPGERHRMFDWKCGVTTLTVRFSLVSLGWSSVRMKCRVFYGNQTTDVAPDSGSLALETRAVIQNELESASERRTILTYPAEFSMVSAGNHIPFVIDAAYGLEKELTGVKPVGGDTLRFVFHPLYDGAAIEGDPIYLGPGMWGKSPLWFVYFHEMGHNFCNAFARFRQLYPLQPSVPPGTMPANVLFYEGFASLPAMYVYDQIEHKPTLLETDSAVINNIRNDWHDVRARFAKAWSEYKMHPSYVLLDPDIIDGMFLELTEKYGWEIFRKFYRLLRPAHQELPVFNVRLAHDTPDLQRTRATLTVAALSAAAGVDLRRQFESWGFPIDGTLFGKARSTLVSVLKAARGSHN